MPSARTPTFAGRVLRGMLWSYGSLASVGVLSLVCTAVLARLLSPRDFGVVALALVFTTLLDATRGLGLNQGLIVTDGGRLRESASSAFWFSLLFGAALAVVIAALSPFAADFFDQPQLLGLLSVLGLTLPLRSLGLTHYALAQRELNFRSRTVAEVCEVVVRGGAGIGLALAGLGPWSLVLGYLAGTAAWVGGLWALVAWRPALRLRRSEVSPLLRFGGPLTVVVIVGTAMSYVDNLLVGKVLGTAALGQYTLGFRLPELLIVDVVAAAGLVLFPAFASLHRSALRAALLRASQYALLVALPVAVALITLADPLVLALFGARWRPAAAVIQLLSIGFVGWPLGQVAGSAYQATKRVDVMVKLAVPQGVLLVAALVIFVHDGIAAVAACQAVVRVAFVVIGVYVSTRILELRLRDLFAVGWPAAIAAAGMAAVIIPLEHAITSPWPALLVCSILGGGVYLGLAWTLAGDAIPSLLRLVVARTARGQVEGVRT